MVRFDKSLITVCVGGGDVIALAEAQEAGWRPRWWCQWEYDGGEPNTAVMSLPGRHSLQH